MEPLPNRPRKERQSATSDRGSGPPLKNRLRFWVSETDPALNENHPVLMALNAEWQCLLDAYQQTPNEHNRYQLTRLERLIAQWAPERLARA
jgi:hypothetical protein